MPSQPYNVAIIGYGFSAKVFHIPLIAALTDFHLYAIVQRSPTPNDDAEKDHPRIECYRSSEDMVEDPDVHVVVVTSTPSSHFELTKLALEHGKHGKRVRNRERVSGCGMLTIGRSGGGEAVHAYASRGRRADRHCEEAPTLAHRLSKCETIPAPASLHHVLTYHQTVDGTPTS